MAAAASLIESYGHVASPDLVTGIMRWLRLDAPRAPHSPTAESKPSGPLAAALRRGQQARARLLGAEGGVVTATAVAMLLDLSVEVVEDRRRGGRLLGLDLGQGAIRYPVWQFSGSRLLPGLETVLEDLQEHDPWSKLIFFLNPNVVVGGVPPLTALRQGQLEAVRRAAQAHGEQVAV
jgi:hypothetical protein